jgi:lysozyme
MIQGVDIWQGYGNIDFDELSKNVGFVYIKCTQGNDYQDQRFNSYVSGCNSAGIPCGAYHFAYPLPIDLKHPGRSAVEQAQRFFDLATHQGRSSFQLIPALDAEWPRNNEWSKWGIDAQSISTWYLDFCVETEKLWGAKPIIYTYPFFWHSLISADISWAQDYKLWIANYTHSGEGMPLFGEKPLIPMPWNDWTVWQYSADKSPISIPGIPACPIDRDCIRNEHWEIICP